MTRLLSVAMAAIDAVDHTSISLRSHESAGFYTPWASADVARTLDHIQYDLGEGPCVAAVASGEVQAGAMVTSDFPWPELAERARPYPLGSVLSTPIHVGAEAVGALNLYSRKRDGLDAEAVDRAAQLASLASALLAVAGPAATALAVAASAGRDTVMRAQGILMAAHGCGPGEAFAILRRTAVRDNRPLHEIAQELPANLREADA